MQDNATTEMLVRYMDGEMSAAEHAAIEKRLQEDAALQERFQYLLAAKKAIRSQGIKNCVRAIHQEYTQQLNKEAASPAKTISRTLSFKIFMRIAAVFLTAIVGYCVFQYVATTNQSVYNANYIHYQLPVNRGANQTDDLDALFSAGDYKEVITVFNSKSSKNQKDYFLAGQAFLQLNDGNAAIHAFRQVDVLNNRRKEQYFEQETDYYLMLAYIKTNEIDSAESLLDKITSNRRHLFYDKAKNISRIKLTMLKWKE